MITVREQSVNQLQAMLRGGETTSVALVESYLARIERLGSAPYHLNAISDLNPNALDEAFAADKARLAEEASQEKQRIQSISRHLLDDMLKDNNVLLGDDTKLINLAAIAGYPSLTVPTGRSDDLYIHGLSSVIMVAKPFNEIALKVIGESIESHHQRLIPEF